LLYTAISITCCYKIVDNQTSRYVEESEILEGQSRAIYLQLRNPAECMVISDN